VAASRRIALLLLIVAVGATLWQTPFAFRDVVDGITAWAGKTPLDRELAPADATGIAARVLLGAQRLIPANAVYHVAPGPIMANSPWYAYRPLSFYWLFPRRYSNDIGPARWILSFNGGFRQLGLDYSRVWHVARGVVVAKVRR
jgi:hypothetical protein